MKPAIVQLSEVKGIVDLANKANQAKTPLVVSLGQGEELVAMTPAVLDALLYSRAYLEAYLRR